MSDASAFRPLLVALIFFHSLGLHSNVHPMAASAPSMEADRQALLCLKSQLHDPSGALSSWRNDSSKLCSWHGVTCSNSTRYAPRVVALDLESVNLTGKIFPCVSELSFLARLHMPDNQISGQISPEIGRLTRLRYLNLSMNALSGKIPDTLSSCSRLEIIDLVSNSLGGEIPASLGQCSYLQQILLSVNNIQGEIPEQFGLLPNLYALFIPNNKLTGTIPELLGSRKSLVYVNLQNNSLSGGIPPALFNSMNMSYIDLSHNHLSGSIPNFPQFSSPLRYLSLTSNLLSGKIPTSIGNLSSLSALLLADNNLNGSIPESLGNIAPLREIDLSYNYFTGIVPPTIYALSSLEYLYLGNNYLAGRIPTDIGYKMPSIRLLTLEANQIEGPIPASLNNATNLNYVDLRNNKFTGVIPSLGSLTELTHLDLGENRLQAGDWSFFSSLTYCSQLKDLWLDSNILQGVLPISITNLSNSVQTLFLSDNKISGVIPSDIGKLTGLTVLRMERNFLSGHIPETVGNLQNLFNLSLFQNNFSGEIPHSIGKLDKLSELHLQGNNLTGQIPPSLAGCQNLVLLNLSSNNFHGSIPKELCSIVSLSKGLDLSYNQFTGSIPLEVGKLNNLGMLSVSSNQLSGEIPTTLGQCVLLGSLHLEANFLQGRIPLSLSSLGGIIEMDVSQNNLSGQIPDFFKNFRSLKILNLSSNDFEGAVPSGGIFTNSSVVFLQGNNKLCASSPVPNLPLCKATPSKRRMSYIFAVVVPVATVAVVIMTLITTIFLKKRSAEQEKNRRVADQSFKKFKSYSYDDLFQATDGFTPEALVGSGKFGLVYRGQFMSEVDRVAIKVFRLDQFGAPKNFIAECEALRNIRHRNLMRVISVCSTFDPTGKEFKALILDYMVNGNMESWLHPRAYEERPKRRLTLGSRIAISVDIAAALDYLHNRCTPPLVHCDLKPSNILLDDEMVACLSDFGLAKFLYSDSSTGIYNSASIVGPQGSVGYIAPEYGMGCKISTEGDVYSYGIILLEMITGRCPSDEMFKDGLNLHNMVESAITGRFGEVLEPNLCKYHEGETAIHAEEEMQGYAKQLAELGLKCSASSPKNRPTMEFVYAEVLAIKEKFLALRR